jgi:hypothetical protein
MKHSKEWSCIHKLPDSRKTTDSVKQQLEKLQGLALCSWCCGITLQEKQHFECEHQLALQSGGAYDDDDDEEMMVSQLLPISMKPSQECTAFTSFPTVGRQQTVCSSLRSSRALRFALGVVASLCNRNSI